MFRFRQVLQEILAAAFPGQPILLVCRGACAEAGIVRLPCPASRRRRGSSRNMACVFGLRRARSTRPASSPISATIAKRWRASVPASACSICAATPAGSRFTPRRWARRRRSSASISMSRCIALAKQNANLNQAKIRFVQGDLFSWLRDIRADRGSDFDVVILDPSKQTRDREEIDFALKRYFDMNKLALQAVAPGGIFLTCSCTGLVSEEMFLETLPRRLADEPNAANPQDRRRRGGSSVPGACAGRALSEGGVLPGGINCFKRSPCGLRQPSH